jgi:membrane associated rhomboid family serine protease
MRPLHRNYGPRFNWRSYFPPAIRFLILACSAVFLAYELSLLLGGVDGAEFWLRWFGLVPRAVTNGLRIWQPFTYLFLHAGIWHLLINMLVLWMFGADLERVWGTRRFYSYYFICGVGAGLINVLVKTVMDPGGHGAALLPTIGASGAIYGVLLAAAVVFPDRQVWIIPFPITIPMRIYVIVMGAVEFFSTLGSTGDNVSHICHLGGMLVGYIYLRRGSFGYNVRNRYSDWRRRRLRRKFETYVRDHQDKPPSHPDNWVN